MYCGMTINNLTAPLSVDNKIKCSADGYSFKGWDLTSCWYSEPWRVLRLSSSAQRTDKSDVCWEKKRKGGGGAGHKVGCNARVHKLGNLPPETCKCRKANQKEKKNAWKNLTAGRLAVFHPPLPLQLSSAQERILMTKAPQSWLRTKPVRTLSDSLYHSCRFQ